MEGQEVFLLGRLKGVVVIIIACLLVYLVYKTKSIMLNNFLEKFISLSERYPVISISNFLVVSVALLIVVLTFIYV